MLDPGFVTVGNAGFDGERSVILRRTSERLGRSADDRGVIGLGAARPVGWLLDPGFVTAGKEGFDGERSAILRRMSESEGRDTGD